jgi:hypothetical protein
MGAWLLAATAPLIPLWPSPALAQVVLSTTTAPRIESGPVRCSGVNVGATQLDMTVDLIDVNTGTIEISRRCANNDPEADEEAVDPSTRCTVVSESDAIVFCKITVDIAGGSGGTSNPALAQLSQRVRGNVTATGPTSSVVLEAR